MKNLKKAMAILMAVMMIPSILTACGSTHNSSSSPESSGTLGDNQSAKTTISPEASIASTGKEESYVFQLGNVWLDDQAINVALKEVIKNIEERTNGTIKIQLFPNGEIASYKDAVEQVVRGAKFIACDDPSMMGDYVPDFSAFVGPNLYNNVEEFCKMCESDLAKDLMAKAEEKGIKILSLNYIAGYRTYVGKKPITKPSDLNNVKLRVPASPLWVETLSAMGAKTVTLPWSEVYTGLQQGIIDALETTVTDVRDNQLQEVTTNISFTNHGLMTLSLIINDNIWNSLSENQRTIMQEEFEKGAAVNNKLVAEAESIARQELEAAGMKFNDVDNDAFAASTKVVFTKFPEFSADVYDRIQAELAKIRS